MFFKEWVLVGRRREKEIEIGEREKREMVGKILKKEKNDEKIWNRKIINMRVKILF